MNETLEVIPIETLPELKNTVHHGMRRLHPCVNKHGWHNLKRRRIAALKLRKYAIPRPAKVINLGPTIVEEMPVDSFLKKIWRIIVKCLDKVLP